MGLSSYTRLIEGNSKRSGYSKIKEKCNIFYNYNDKTRYLRINLNTFKNDKINKK